MHLTHVDAAYSFHWERNYSNFQLFHSLLQPHVSNVQLVKKVFKLYLGAFVNQIQNKCARDKQKACKEHKQSSLLYVVKPFNTPLS